VFSSNLLGRILLITEIASVLILISVVCYSSASFLSSISCSIFPLISFSTSLALSASCFIAYATEPSVASLAVNVVILSIISLALVPSHSDISPIVSKAC